MKASATKSHHSAFTKFSSVCGMTWSTGLLLLSGLIGAAAHADKLVLKHILNPPNPAFYNAIDLSDDYALIGGSPSYLFDVKTGVLLQTFNDPEANSNGSFGSAVALSGNTVLISNPFYEINGVEDIGRVYMFDVVSGNLLNVFDDPTLSAVEFPDEHFGASIALSADYVLIGNKADGTYGENCGQAHLFDTVTGALLRTFDNPDSPCDGGANSGFGHKVALSGDTVLILSSGGSPFFLFDAKTGILLNTLPDSFPSTGNPVVTNNYVLYGSNNFPTNPGNPDYTGIVALHDVASGALLKEFTYLSKPNPAPLGSWFAYGYDLHGNVIMVTENDISNFMNGYYGGIGLAHLFLTTGALLQTIELPVPITSPSSVALTKDKALISFREYLGGIDNYIPRTYLYGPCLLCSFNYKVHWPEIWFWWFSLPVGEQTTYPIADVFADYLPLADYGQRWRLNAWNSERQTFETLSLEQPLQAGVGYALSSELLPSAGIPAPQASPQQPAEPALQGNASGQLNLLAQSRSSLSGVCWRDVGLLDPRGRELALTDVDAEGLCWDESGCAVANRAYRWNGAAFDVSDGLTPGTATVLPSFSAFWVKAFQSNYRLKLPEAGSSDCFLPELGRDEWYQRLIVSADGLEDRYNLLGQLRTSSDGRDRHDLSDLPPVGETYLNLVFPHAEWRNQASHYNSDYRAIGGDNTWDFEVHSNQAREITLSWEDPQGMLERVTLVDLESRQEIQPRGGGHFRVEMRDNVHRFQWQVQQ